MISLNFYNGEILISSSYDYKDKIRELSYRNWDPNLKVWKTTVNNLNEVLEKFPEASLSEGLVEYINHRKKTTEQSRAVFSSGKVELGDFGKGKELLPFQKAGLEFIDLTFGRAIVADNVGLGKTIQALAYLPLVIG
jgi:SNF2 family DNA or RNA helicase